MTKPNTRRKLFGFDIIGHIEAIWTGFQYLFKPRATVMYPEVYQEFSQNYRGMLKFFDDRCISCTMCARICPSGAIKMHKVEAKKWPGITYQRCIFCGFCRDICPVNALEMLPVHDKAYYGLDEQIQSPQEFIRGPQNVEDLKKVKPVFDEKRGLKYGNA